MISIKFVAFQWAPSNIRWTPAGAQRRQKLDKTATSISFTLSFAELDWMKSRIKHGLLLNWKRRLSKVFLFCLWSPMIWRWISASEAWSSRWLRFPWRTAGRSWALGFACRWFCQKLRFWKRSQEADELLRLECSCLKNSSACSRMARCARRTAALVSWKLEIEARWWRCLERGITRRWSSPSAEHLQYNSSERSRA